MSPKFKVDSALKPYWIFADKPNADHPTSETIIDTPPKTFNFFGVIANRGGLRKGIITVRKLYIKLRTLLHKRCISPNKNKTVKNSAFFTKFSLSGK